MNPQGRVLRAGKESRTVSVVNLETFFLTGLKPKLMLECETPLGVTAVRQSCAERASVCG